MSSGSPITPELVAEVRAGEVLDRISRQIREKHPQGKSEYAGGFRLARIPMSGDIAGGLVEKPEDVVAQMRAVADQLPKHIELRKVYEHSYLLVLSEGDSESVWCVERGSGTDPRAWREINIPKRGGQEAEFLNGDGMHEAYYLPSSLLLRELVDKGQPSAMYLLDPIS